MYNNQNIDVSTQKGLPPDPSILRQALLGWNINVLNIVIEWENCSLATVGFDSTATKLSLAAYILCVKKAHSLCTVLVT